MNTSISIRFAILLVVLAAIAGCGSQRGISSAFLRHPPPGDQVSDADEFGDSEIDSLSADADRLLDDLFVSADSLASLGYDLGDISDSLAAATWARLPSVEELFDYPVVVNRKVLVWIDMFQGRGHGIFQRSLNRSGRYLPMARQIFAEEGVPQDLVFIAHIESGFRFNARSPASALGLWQFMRGTAVMYGLRCDKQMDERLDPERSTRAAAKHLRDLHNRYGDWYLAMAAYNAGAGKVDKAIARAGSRNFWEIAETKHLLQETRNFVPAILAATILAKSPAAWSYSEETDAPIEYENLVVDTPTDLTVIARCAGVPLAELQQLNPSLLRGRTPAARHEVRVPRGIAAQTALALSQLPVAKRVEVHAHTVKKGDTLGQLAKRYGCSVGEIQQANRMGKSTTIRIGQSLAIPNALVASASPKASDDAAARSGAGPAQDTRHVVRRGEGLTAIAARYRVDAKALQRHNGIRNPNHIQVGQVLRIPGRSSGAEGTASTGVAVAAVATDAAISIDVAVVPGTDLAGDGAPSSGVSAAPGSPESPASTGSTGTAGKSESDAATAAASSGAPSPPSANATQPPAMPAATSAAKDMAADGTAHERKSRTVAPSATAPATVSGSPTAAPSLANAGSSAEITAGPVPPATDDPTEFARALGRVASTVHIVDRARREIERQIAGPALAGESPAGREAARSGSPASPDKATSDTRAPAAGSDRGGIQRSTNTAPTDASAARTHRVRRGETLSSIAREHDVRASDLQKWNRLGGKTTIHPGQKLRVSQPGSGANASAKSQVHIVRKGETVNRIAQKYGVSAREVSERNGIDRRGRIQPGQKLIIQ